MKLAEAFPSDYLKCEDLNKRKRNLTIASVTMEKIGKDKENKLVVWFDNEDKGLILNKTNANMIAFLLDTDDTDDWEGQMITIKPSTTEFGGKTVPCIRVADELPDVDKPAKSERGGRAGAAVARHASAADREFDERPGFDDEPPVPSDDSIPAF